MPVSTVRYLTFVQCPSQDKRAGERSERGVLRHFFMVFCAMKTSSFDSAIERNLESWLRWSFAIVYVWFGALKLVDLSPAHDLVELTLSWTSISTIVTVLGVCEVILGLMFLVPKLTKVTLVLFLIHMAGTFIPIASGFAVAYTAVPYGLTLVGQYIIKNLVFLAAGASLYISWRNRTFPS